MKDEMSPLSDQDKETSCKLSDYQTAWEWILDSLRCLDKCTVKEGYTPLQMIAISGNLDLFDYFMNILEARNQF